MAAALDRTVAAPIDSRAAALYRGEAGSQSAREVLRLIRKAWPFIARHRRLLALKCILSFTSLAFFLLIPWPIKIVIDNVIDGHPLSGLPRLLLFPIAGDNRALLLTIVSAFLLVTAILIGTSDHDPHELGTGIDSVGFDSAGFGSNDANDGWSLWSGLFGLLEVRVTIDLTQRINQTVRTAIYERFLRSPLKLYADQKIGDAIFRVMHDSASIGAILYTGILAPLLSIFAFLMTIVILTAQFHDEWFLPLLAALLLPVVAFGSGLFSRKIRDQSQRARESGSAVMSAFEERIAHVHLIKAFGQEDRERAAVDESSWNSFRAAFRLVGIVLLILLTLWPAAAWLFGAGLYAVMAQVIAGKISLGDVALLATYAAMLGRPMGIIGSTWASIQGPAAGLRRMYSVLDRLTEAHGDGGAREIPRTITELYLRDVSVAYDSAAPVLQHVTLTLRAGEMAALAGPNGSGKSTLIYSIPRFIEPCAGAILINGTAAREFEPAAIRKRMGFVFQHEALFSATIADNIRYGSSGASDQEVAAAAAMAGAAGFIERLPDGYATRLGRRGARLSVGQKQRIAIARALLRSPDVLILDEPTAPLDPSTEAGLMQTLASLARERIVLLIAHRPETLAACDVVHFLHDGTLAASGTHAELLKTSPAYRSYLAADSLV
jgi:ABC-type multidrug transport system fused ATPase/permease subunit